MRQKKQKFFPECLPWHSGNASSSPSALFWHSGKGLFPECQGRHSGKNFFKSFNGVGGVARQVICFFAECRSFPSVALGEEGLCRVLLFTECQDLCGTRESLSSPSATLGEDSLFRVPDFWHSGKPATLGEFCLSRSVLLFVNPPKTRVR